MAVPTQWIVNSTIGKLKINVTQMALPAPSNPSGGSTSVSVTRYWEIGETWEGSVCSCPAVSSMGITQARCSPFKLIGKSGTQYNVVNDGSYALKLVVGSNEFIMWSGALNAVTIPDIFFDGTHVGYHLGGQTMYPSNTNSYALNLTQVGATSAGYVVATAKARLGGGFSVIYADGTQTSNLLFKALYDILVGGKPVSDDPYDNLPIGGEEPIPGGGTVGIPGFPGLTATSAGVIGLFAPTAAQMQQLADFMWTDFGGTATDIFEVLQELVEAVKRSISNPLDYIIGLNIIPSQGLSIGSSKVVRFGFVSSGVSMPQLANQYFTVDCGSLSFDTLCGDTFLDYAPYSKFSIYLPYIGFKDVDPNDFVGHTIGVVYHGDVVTGGVTAYITKDGSVMYQYSGCCALNVPLSADNWGETIGAAINVATGIVAAASTGGAAGVAVAAAKGAANVAANPSLLSPQVSHSGAVSGGAGCMGVQYPFVIREAVNFHSTDGFNKSAGYPAYYYKLLADVTGFTTVIDAHMTGIPMATQDEIQEIESLLESGVIL